MLPPIKGFIGNSLLDWPGRICCIIFLPGCNFRCPFCHAAHLVLDPNELESIPFESVREHLESRADWIDGVVISGGEPTLCEGLFELMRTIRNLGFDIKLDTNGTRPEVVRKAVQEGLIQAVAMDIKAPLDRRYHDLAGTVVDLDKVRETIELLLGGIVAEYEFRTTVVPGLLDGDDIEEIARTIEGAQAYVLQNFQPVDCIDPDMMHKGPWSPDDLQAMAMRAGKYAKNCYVRGFEEANHPVKKG